MNKMTTDLPNLLIPTKKLLTSTPVDNKEMKREDLLQFLNVYSSEFNNSRLHDRVLVFKVNGEEDEFSSEEDKKGKEREEREEKKEKDEKVKEIEENKDGDVGEKEEWEEEEEESENVEEKEREEKKVEEIEKGKEEEIAKEGEEKRKCAELQETITVVYGETNDGKRVETPKQNDEMKEVENDEDGIACNATSPDKQPNKHKVFVHSSWLAVQSTYFRSLFYSGLKESHSKEVVMNIDENELQSHLTLIEAMYKLDILNDKDYSLVTEVLVLAFKYDVNLVFKKCKYVLMDTPLTLEKCESILKKTFCLQNCDDLLEVLTKFLVKEFSPLDKTWTMEKFTDLSEAALRLILSSNDLAVQSENTVFVALMKWIRYDSARQSQLSFSLSFNHSSLLNLVRFELMSVDFLYDVVRKHSTAKGIRGFSQLLQKGLAYHGFSEERRNELKDKPVQRTSFEDEGPTYSWVIDNDVRIKLSHSGEAVWSSRFWYRGYEMALNLSYDAMSMSFSVYLFVLDIRTEGCLNLSWTAKSNLFRGHSFTVCQMYSNGSSWGQPKVRSKLSLLPSFPERSSDTIDVWVKFK